MNDLLTSTQAASLLFVSPETLRRYESRGLIKARRTSGGHRRFLKEDVETLKANFEIKSVDLDTDEKIDKLKRAEQVVVLKKLLEELGLESPEDFSSVGEVSQSESEIFANYLFVSITNNRILKKRMGYLLVSDDWEHEVFYLDNTDYIEPEEALSTEKIRTMIDYAKGCKIKNITDTKTLWDAVKMNRKGTICVSLIVLAFLTLFVLAMGAFAISHAPSSEWVIGEAIFTGVWTLFVLVFSIWITHDSIQGINEKNRILLFDESQPACVPWLVKQIKRLPNYKV